MIQNPFDSLYKISEGHKDPEHHEARENSQHSNVKHSQSQEHHHHSNQPDSGLKEDADENLDDVQEEHAPESLNENAAGDDGQEEGEE